MGSRVLSIVLRLRISHRRTTLLRTQTPKLRGPEVRQHMINIISVVRLILGDGNGSLEASIKASYMDAAEGEALAVVQTARTSLLVVDLYKGTLPYLGRLL